MGRRSNLLLGVCLLALGGAITSLSYFSAVNTGGRYLVTVGLFVVGILRILSGLKSDDASPHDPGARLTEHEWSNDEQAWTIGEALGMALWTMRKVRWKAALVALPIPLAAFGAAIGAAAFTPQILALLAGERMRSPFLQYEVRAIIAALVSVIMGVIVLPPIIKLCLAAMRSEKVTLSDTGGRYLAHLPRLVGFAFLYFVLVVVTLPLLSLVAIPFVLTPFFIVDQDLPLIEAMRRSWRATSRHFGKLWLYHVAFLPLVLIGNLTGIGVVLTTPLFIAGLAYAYVRLTGRVGMPYFPPEAGSAWIRSFLRISLLALTAVFGGLIFWVENLPTLRGSAWNIRDALIRASAIVTGVAVIILMMALILPYMLDQLEGRRFTAFVAARHVRSQKSGFLTVISVLSICGVAISSCALSSVVSVMGGFSQDLKRKILGNNAHIVVDTTPGTPFGDYETALERIRKIPGVVGATPVVHGEVMASSASNLAGVVVTGIEPGSIRSVIELTNNIEVGKLDYLEHPERLTRLPAQEVIGIGPGGEQYFKGADLPGLADDIDPVGARGHPQQARSSRRDPRARAREDTPRLHRRRGDARLTARRSRADGRHATHEEVPRRGHLLQRHVRVRRDVRVHDDGHGAGVLPDRRQDQRDRGQGRRRREGRPHHAAGRRRGRTRGSARPRLARHQQEPLQRAQARTVRDLHHPVGRDHGRELLHRVHAAAHGDREGQGDRHPQGHRRE